MKLIFDKIDRAIIIYLYNHKDNKIYKYKENKNTTGYRIYRDLKLLNNVSILVRLKRLEEKGIVKRIRYGRSFIWSIDLIEVKPNK